MDAKINEQLAKRGLEAARAYAPKIESVVAHVQDKELRPAIGGAVMGWLLAAMTGGSGPTEERALRSAGTVEQRTKVAKGESLTGTQGRIMEMADEGFFREPRQVQQIRDELRVRGYHHNRADVRMSLLRLARKKLLRRIPVGNARPKTFAYVQR